MLYLARCSVGSLGNQHNCWRQEYECPNGEFQVISTAASHMKMMPMESRQSHRTLVESKRLVFHSRAFNSLLMLPSATTNRSDLHGRYRDRISERPISLTRSGKSISNKACQFSLDVPFQMLPDLLPDASLVGFSFSNVSAVIQKSLG